MLACQTPGGNGMVRVGEMDAPRRRAVGRSPSSRRRYLYFGLASLWGYGMGILTLVVGLSRLSAPVTLDADLAVWLAVGSLLGLAGGGIVAGAYRESQRRHH